MEFSAVEIDSLCLSRLFAVFPAHTEHWPPFSLCWALQCYLLTQKANEKIPDHYIILWNLTVFLPLSQSSDFSDITNWPTPGELAKEVWYVWMQLLLQAMRACFLVLLLAASKMDLFFQFLLTRWSARSILKCSGCSFAEGWCRFLKRGCLIKCKKVFWFWSHMVRCVMGGIIQNLIKLKQVFSWLWKFLNSPQVLLTTTSGFVRYRRQRWKYN